MISGQRALLESLRTILRASRPEGYGLPASECDFTSGGRPPTSAPKWFWGLHGGGNQRSARTSLIEQPVIRMTLSVRVNEPADKLGSALLEAEMGLDDRLSAMQAWLGKYQYVWMNTANAMLNAASQVDGFYHPAFDMKESEPVEVGPDWWRSPPPSGGLVTQPGPAGIRTVVTISGFLREQYLESAV